ncbi:serine hydrolase domain-containing protein [Deinococcus koreensis]|nr:serine hydrolase domain-containing protein [Deinococcus koreensis]
MQSAAAYSRAHRGSAVMIWRDGQLLFTQAQNGFDLQTPHLLASGSKSFSCALAVTLMDQGRLDLDEPVSQTLTEWRSDPAKAAVTVRQLLSFTSGLPGDVGSKRTGTNVNLYVQALATGLVATPGERFSYGNAHLAAFGALVQRKTGQDPAALLQRQVLDRIGARVWWGRDQAGQPDLAASARMTAQDWGSYGQLILQDGRWKGQTVLSAAGLRECLRGSATLNIYGLTFWLNRPLAGPLPATDDLPLQALGGLTANQIAPSAPGDLVMAAGALNQRLYLLPSERIVVVRFGEGGAWSDEEFLSQLLADK